MDGAHRRKLKKKHARDDEDESDNEGARSPSEAAVYTAYVAAICLQMSLFD